MPLETSRTEISTSTRRVGDAERSACAEALSEAFARGELTRDELDARTGLCLAAVTDADLVRLIGDLPVRPSTAGSPVTAENAGPGVRTLARFAGFELALVLVAYVLGVDLQSELRAWYLIAFEIWAVGSLAGLAGALLLRAPGGATKVE